MHVKRITPEEAKALLESGDHYSYLDVRTAEEFQAGHVPSAVNIPLMLRNPSGPGMVRNPEFLRQVEGSFQKDSRMIVGCQRGGRSLKAAEILLRTGYTNVLEMRGGYDGERDRAGNVTFPGWARRDFPTSRE